MSSGSSSHLSKSKQDDDPRHALDRRAASVSPLNDGAVDSAFTPSTAYPCDSEDWKQSFPQYYSRCVVPTVSQAPSLLSQICEGMDSAPWAMTQGENYESKIPPPSVAETTISDKTKPELDEAELKKQAEKEKNRTRMRRLRAARDPEKVERDREKARERTRRVRASWNEERRQKERQRAREYMRKRRATKARSLSDD